MKIGIIGRSEITYNSMLLAIENGCEIKFIVTSKAAPEYKYTSKDFQDFAEKNNIPFLHKPNITREEILDLTSSDIPEVCLSVNYSGVISEEVIDLFSCGVLNAHGGDLPRYRGNACQAWAILNGEKEIGLCIHKMIGGELDSGDILAREYLPINVNTKVGEAYQWIEEQTPEMFIRALKSLDNDPNFILERQSTDPAKALRCYPRKPSDGKINWNKGAEDILRLINASSEPFAGAFCSLKDEKLIIWRAELFEDEENYCAIPGQVATINRTKGDVIIITGKGKLKITEIEYQGKRTTPSEVIKSIRTRLI